MKKIFLLIIILFCCSGCTASYTVNLDKGFKFVEDIDIVAVGENDSDKFKDFKMFIPIDGDCDDYSVYMEKVKGISYYNYSKVNDKFVFHNSFKKDEYLNSTIVRSAFDYVFLTEVKKDVVLSSSIGFKLFDQYDNLDEVKIVVNSKFKLKETNADEVSKHKYVWNINRDNASSKYIYLKLNFKDDDRTFLEKLFDGEYINLFTVFVFLCLVGCLIYLFIIKKGDRRNRL